VFCRDAADHFPTISDAVACPYFSDPAMRASFQRAPSNGQACGYAFLISVGVSSRTRVTRVRSRILGVRALPTRSNSAKLISVAPWVSVACSATGRPVALPRKSSSTKCASRAVGTMTFVP
jgi:hypothetical protein